MSGLSGLIWFLNEAAGALIESMSEWDRRCTDGVGVYVSLWVCFAVASAISVH